MSPLDSRFIADPAHLGAFSLATTSVRQFTAEHLPPRQSDRAVVTWVAGEAARQIYRVTGPAMERYSRAVGADFICLEGFGGQWYPLANKFRVAALFTQAGYDRVLYVDSDALITRHCDDLFEMVPYDSIGILDELHLYDEWMVARHHREILAVLASQGIELHGDTYPCYNSGLYVISGTHASVLEPPVKEFPLCTRDGATVEQAWLTIQILRQQVPVFDLQNPNIHWVWYADQDESEAGRAMVLHYAGLAGAPSVRYEKLRQRAERSARGAAEVTHIRDGRDLTNVAYYKQMMLDAPSSPAFRIPQLRRVGSHDRGWDVAGKSLTLLAREDGILLDDFVESSFLWHGDRAFQRGVIPYRSHWVGFIHNPPGSPDWPTIFGESIHRLRESQAWSSSVEHCLGLYALSSYLANWVRAEWNVECEVIRYPALKPEKLFSPEDYLSQERPSLLCLGFWLRRFLSFRKIQAPRYEKVCPMPVSSLDRAGVERVREYERDEWKAAYGDLRTFSALPRVERLSSLEYEDLLSRSVVFLDLIDASAVTTVVECLVRGTPLLINPLPAIVEYLGHDYPMYFACLAEAEEKLADPATVLAAHEHMLQNPMVDELTPASFLKSITATATYARALESLGGKTGGKSW